MHIKFCDASYAFDSFLKINKHDDIKVIYYVIEFLAVPSRLGCKGLISKCLEQLACRRRLRSIRPSRRFISQFISAVSPPNVNHGSNNIPCRLSRPRASDRRDPSADHNSRRFAIIPVIRVRHRSIKFKDRWNFAALTRTSFAQWIFIKIRSTSSLLLHLLLLPFLTVAWSLVRRSVLLAVSIRADVPRTDDRKLRSRTIMVLSSRAPIR